MCINVSTFNIQRKSIYDQRNHPTSILIIHTYTKVYDHDTSNVNIMINQFIVTKSPATVVNRVQHFGCNLWLRKQSINQLDNIIMSVRVYSHTIVTH